MEMDHDESAAKYNKASDDSRLGCGSEEGAEHVRPIEPLRLLAQHIAAPLTSRVDDHCHALRRQTVGAAHHAEVAAVLLPVGILGLRGVASFSPAAMRQRHAK